MNDDNVFISSADAAKLLGIHLNTLYIYIKAKKLPVVRLGRRYKFNKKQLLDLMKDKEFTCE